MHLVATRRLPYKRPPSHAVPQMMLTRLFPQCLLYDFSTFQHTSRPRSGCMPTLTTVSPTSPSPSPTHDSEHLGHHSQLTTSFRGYPESFKSKYGIYPFSVSPPTTPTTAAGRSQHSSIPPSTTDNIYTVSLASTRTLNQVFYQRIKLVMRNRRGENSLLDGLQ